MRSIALCLISLLAGVAVGFFLVQQRAALGPRQQAVVELIHVRDAAEKTLAVRSETLQRQLAAFAEQVANDRGFAMKMLVEMDRTAPEVSEIAARYLKAMGLSILEVADSSDTLVSCGHFPAAAGSSISEKAALLDTQAVCMVDNIQGIQALTMQARARFVIGDAARLSCVGGWVVDEAFLRELVAHKGVRTLLRFGDTAIGMSNVSAMSEIKNNTLILNDTTFLATSLDLPFRGDSTAPKLYLLADMPPKMSLF
jgi:hypothetical protein